MPVKRKRTNRRPVALSPAEIQFLTGVPQPGANVFFENALRAGNLLPRVRELIAWHSAMIPPRRRRAIDKLLATLERAHAH